MPMQLTGGDAWEQFVQGRYVRAGDIIFYEEETCFLREGILSSEPNTFRGDAQV